MFKSILEFKKYITEIANESSKLRSDVNRLLTLANNINNGLKNPFQMHEVEKICIDVINTLPPAYCNSKGQVITFQLAEYMIKKYHIFANGYTLYMYKNGVYTPIDERILGKMVYDLLYLDTNKTTGKSKEIIESIRTISYEVDINTQTQRYINVLNGIIDLKDKKLIKHSHKFKNTLQFCGNYIPEDEFLTKFENSSFSKFLSGTLTPLNIVTLQECFGLILSPQSKKVQKAFIFLGNGSNGKSAVGDIITNLLGGNRFISCLGLSDFEKKFDVAGIEGKFLNMRIDDESVSLEKTGTFKSVVAGDIIDIEKKGKDKVSYVPNILCIIGLNKLPATADRSHGFFRRQMIVNFQETFGTISEVNEGKATKIKNPELISSIINNEMDIVLNWALQGLYKLMSNNYTLSENEEVAVALEQFRLESDSVYAFYKEKIILTNQLSDCVSATSLYSLYQTYCQDNGVTPQNGTNFGKGLAALNIQKKRTNKGVSYAGIMFVDESNIDWDQI